MSATPSKLFKSRPSSTKPSKLIYRLKMLSLKTLFSTFKSNMSATRKTPKRKRARLPLAPKVKKMKWPKVERKINLAFQNLTSARWSQSRSAKETKSHFQSCSCLSSSAFTRPTSSLLMRMSVKFNTLSSVSRSCPRSSTPSLVTVIQRNPSISRKLSITRMTSWSRLATRLPNNLRKSHPKWAKSKIKSEENSLSSLKQLLLVRDPRPLKSRSLIHSLQAPKTLCSLIWLPLRPLLKAKPTVVRTPRMHPHKSSTPTKTYLSWTVTPPSLPVTLVT